MGTTVPCADGSTLRMQQLPVGKIQMCGWGICGWRHVDKHPWRFSTFRKIFHYIMWSESWAGRGWEGFGGVITFLTCACWLHIHTYMHACMHTYIRSYIHTYIYTYIHTCIHAYIHTNIYIYIFIYIFIFIFLLYCLCLPIHIYTYLCLIYLFSFLYLSTLFVLDLLGCFRCYVSSMHLEFPNRL